MCFNADGGRYSRTWLEPGGCGEGGLCKLVGSGRSWDECWSTDPQPGADADSGSGMGELLDLVKDEDSCSDSCLLSIFEWKILGFTKSALTTLMLRGSSFSKCHSPNNARCTAVTMDTIIHIVIDEYRTAMHRKAKKNQSILACTIPSEGGPTADERSAESQRMRTSFTIAKRPAIRPHFNAMPTLCREYEIVTSTKRARERTAVLRKPCEAAQPARRRCRRDHLFCARLSCPPCCAGSATSVCRC